MIGLHVKPNVHDVAVGHGVVLSLDLEQPRVLHRLLRAEPHESFVRDDLRSNEAALQVRVNSAGCLTSQRAPPNRLGTHLVGPDGEK